MTRWCVWPVCSLNYALCFRSWLFKCSSPGKFLWISKFPRLPRIKHVVFFFRKWIHIDLEVCVSALFLVFCSFVVSMKLQFFKFQHLSRNEKCDLHDCLVSCAFYFSRKSWNQRKHEKWQKTEKPEYGKPRKNVFSWRLLISVIGRLISGSVCPPCF